MSAQNRVQAGIPIGGQWAESAKARPDVTGLDVKAFQAGDMTGVEFGHGDPDTEARIGKYFDDFNDGLDVGARRPQSYVTTDDLHIVTTDIGFDVQIDRTRSASLVYSSWLSNLWWPNQSGMCYTVE
ncbi:hypothetical protein [Brevibacterium aurantiacum]|uniref:Uncharacterized protein n=1 Tax=Brevibacterium aurantiacum TaxID=273384 RepID=A0A556CAZ8_BREAU|nr:hypothetical protein [Brevibacterium aurantiacum]TSI14486.1 hypothetical protein FO013_13970 [Brevibacterium aurantiacum]